MIAAGYDPREAPRVWKVVTTKFRDSRTNFFWSDHNNNATRRSYLMAELRNNYADIDYSKLQTGEERFKAITVLLSAKAPTKKLKVKY